MYKHVEKTFQVIKKRTFNIRKKSLSLRKILDL